MFNALENKIKEKKFSGVITIRKNDKILYNKAYGYSDRANQIKNNTKTSFGVASGTKIFTALGILKLVQQNKIHLDTKLFDLIDKPFHYDPSVTIKQLLSHTSGLPDYYDEDLITDFDNFKVSVPWCDLLKPSHYLPVMPDRTMKFAPGESFHYNNGAFVLLALVIETMTGDYHQWIQNEILTPHGLNHTGFYKFNELPVNTANGYMGDDQSLHTNIYNLPIVGGGDGGIFTSSPDLLNFWTLLMDNKLIPKSLTEILLTPHSKKNEGSHYGLGVWLDEKDGLYNPSIVGSDAGVSFFSDHLIKEKITVNVMSNTSSGAWDVMDLVKALIKKI